MLEALASNPDGHFVVLADQKNGRILVRIAPNDSYYKVRPLAFRYQ